MSPASAAKLKATSRTPDNSKFEVVASDRLARTKVWGETDPTVRWAGAFAVYGIRSTTSASEKRMHMDK